MGTHRECGSNVVRWVHVACGSLFAARRSRDSSGGERAGFSRSEESQLDRFELPCGKG